MTRFNPALNSGVASVRHLNNGLTHRGCRTGRSKQRPIVVLIYPPPSLSMVKPKA